MQTDNPQEPWDLIFSIRDPTDILDRQFLAMGLR